MPRRKRKLVVEENDEVCHTPRVTRRSTRELQESETIKVFNNCINETEDASLASQIDVDSMLETKIEPKIEELTLKMTEVNNNPASNISDTSSNKWTREIDLIIPTMKPKKSRIRKPRSTQRKALIKLKPLEINNNPGCDAESAPSESCGETESINISNPTLKCMNEPTVRAAEEIINSKAIERNDCLMCESAGDTVSDSYSKVDSMLEIVKPEENLMCPTDDTSQKTLTELELSKMDYNIECKTKDTCSIIEVPIVMCDTKPKNDTSVDSFLEIDSISEISNPETKHVLEVGDIVVTDVDMKSESIERSHHPEPTSEDTASGASINSTHLIPNTSKPTQKRGRPLKKLIKVEPTEINVTPGKCETKDTLSVPKVGSNLLSDGIKPKPKRIRKSHAKLAKKLIESKPLEGNVDLECKGDYALLAIQVETDLVSATTKPKMKRVRKSRAKVRDKVLQSGNIEMNNDPASKIELTLTTKPKMKRVRKSRAKVRDKVSQSGNIEMNNDPASKIELTLTTKPKMKRVRKSRAKVRDKVLQSGNVEMNNNPASKIKLTLPKSCSRADSVPEFVQMKDNSVYMSEEPLHKVEPETNSVTIEPLRINDEHMNEVNNSSSEDHDLNHSISKIVEDKYHLLDSMYQPKVLLWNVAYSDKLSPKQKKMLLKKNESGESLTSINVSDTSTSRSMERSTPSDITIVSPELERKSDETMKSVLGIKTCEYKHSNSGKVRDRKKEKKTRESKFFIPIKRRKMPKIKLMHSETHTKMDILSSVENKKSSIQPKLTASPRTSSKQRSSTQQNDSYKMSTKLPLHPQERNIVVWPRSDTIELNASLNLSNSTTDVLISNLSEFANTTDTSVREFCPGTNKHQLRDMNVPPNVHENGFRSSTFKERDPSTSSSKIDDSVNLPQPDTVSKLSDMLDSGENRDFEFEDETITFYKAPKSAGGVSPPTTVLPKCVIKETFGNREKSLSSDEFSIKVSIPTKHYFNKHTTMCKELDKVLKQVGAAPTKAQMKSYAEVDKAHHPASENITSSISDQKPIKINLIPAKSGTPTTSNSTTTPLRDMCRLNDTDTYSPKTLTKSNADIMAFEPTLLGSTMKLTTSNIRSLPRIVNDELFPKGTIKFTSIASVPNTQWKSGGTEIGDVSYSNNVNEMNERKNIPEVKIHQQSTSAVNVSQARTSARFEIQDHSYAAAEIDIIDIDQCHDVGDNLKEFKNVEEQPTPPIHITQLHGINSQKVPEKMETEITDQSSVFQQHFDSTQLWKICPELAMYFGHDDVVNNNNDNNLANNDTLNTAETNCNNNSVHTFSTTMKPVTNEDHTTDLHSNDVGDATNNSNNLGDVSQGVIAVKTDYSEIEEEYSDSIACNDELIAEKNTVLADLTTTNLRNFNSISKHNDEGGPNWSIKTYQHYLLHRDTPKSSSELVPDDAIEVGCKLTESTVESHKEFSQTECKKRKRKWIQNENDTQVKPMKERRLKLNRNRWSVDPQDFESTSNSQKQTSVRSNCSNNSVARNLFESTQSTKKTSFGESNTAKKTTNEQPNLPQENKESSEREFNCKAEDLVQRIENCTPRNEKNNEQTSTIISAYTTADVDSKSLDCEFGNASPKPVGKIDIVLPQSTENRDHNAGVDRNGNFTSSSSSSSSSSQSNKSISNPKEESQPNEDQYQKEKGEEEEMDADCISLFAESIFTNFEHATSLRDTVGMSPLFHLPTDSNDKFQDMVDVGTYFEKNIQECNEAYESCMQNVDNMDNIGGNLKQPNFFSNENPCEIPPLQKNINHPSNQWSGQLYPQATALQRSNVNNILNLRDKVRANCEAPDAFFIDVECFFAKHCYQKLRRGFCNRDGCHFYHHLTPGLHDLEQNEPHLVNKVIDYAIHERYHYFIHHKYPEVVMRMDYPTIIRLFYKLSDAGLMNEYFVDATFSGAKRLCVSLREFVSDIASLLTEEDDDLAECILRTFIISIEPGDYWDTFRVLLIRTEPSNLRTYTIIRECIHSNKNKTHVEDVYNNYLRKLTAEELSSININLRRQLDLLLIKYNLIPAPKHLNQPAALFGNINSEFSASENDCKIRIEVPTILSPDDPAHYHSVNASHLFSGTNAASHNTSSQNSTVTQMQYQNTEPQSVASNHNLFIQRHVAETQVKPSVKQYSSDLDISRTSEPGFPNLSSSSYKLHPIDDLPPPRSMYHDRHWTFHLAMHNLKEALKHEEYSLALKILNRYSDKDRTLFISSCYKMLRENVMTSSHHVKNMIKLSVRMRVNKFLKETLFTLGMYTMIELCDTNAWVLAYRLCKCMRRSASLTDKNAAFDLISAEICLANRRPLKAFTILKQNNMLCESRSKWSVVSNPNDEHGRIMIIHLLLDVLCQEYPDRAFYLFTHCLRDQARIYHPIDLTAHIDNLVTSVLGSECNDSITNVTRMIFEYNFTLEKSVFQSLVVKIFQNDVTLCRQLYRYGTWLGVYPIIKLTLPLHIIIKTNWRREEIYLVILDFLEKLSMDIGPAIDRITPNQFTIHLVFELAPFKEPLTNDNVQISNKDELKASKEITKTVLREQFNPPLRTILAEKERFMKLQNRSVVTYLKSMNVQS